MSLRQANENAVRAQTYFQGTLVDYGFGIKEGASLKEVNHLEQKLDMIYHWMAIWRAFLLPTAMHIYVDTGSKLTARMVELA